MTVSNTTVKLTYAGNGSNRTFGITFPLLSAAHLRVVVTDPDGVETNITSNYAINTALNALTYPTIASGLDPLATGYTITLVRQTPLTQEIDLEAGMSLDAAELEHGYDKLTLAVQEVKEEVDRAVKTSVSGSAPATAEAYMEAITAAKEAAESAANSAAGSASEAVIAQATAAASATEAATSAASASSSADTATSAAVVAQSAEEGAQIAQAAAETAAASITTAISDHNQSADAHADLLAAKQPKTLDTPISVAGESKTTVEAALSAINTLAAGKAPASHTHTKTDITDLPNIPTKLSELTDDLGTSPTHTHSQYLTEIPKADANTLGGIKPDGVSFVVAADGTASATGNITVDSALSATSENPVQNKVVKAAIDNKQDVLPDGATGLFLKKTADGVAWAQPSGGGGGGGSAEWGSIGGTLADQTDLKNALDAKQDALSTAQQNAANSGVTAAKVSGYDTHVANDDTHVTAAQKSAWSGKQDAINDLSTIRTNAAAGKSAADAQATYGDVVTHDASEFQAAGDYAPASHTHTKSQVTDMPTKLSDFTDDLGTSPTHTHSQYLTDVPVATTSVAGKVKPDGTTITAAADGTLSAVGGGSSSSLTATYDSTNKVLTLR